MSLATLRNASGGEHLYAYWCPLVAMAAALERSTTTARLEWSKATATLCTVNNYNNTGLSN